MQTSASEKSRCQAKAASNVYAILSAVFAYEPTEEIVRSVIETARIMDAHWTEEVHVDSLRARYAERFIVPSSRWYVPLSENCIRTLTEQCGLMTFGQVDGPYRAHVSKCYAAVGFEFDVSASRADSLAAELSFMSCLAAAQVNAATDGAAQSALRWQQRFLDDHLGAWVGQAARALLRSDDDFYAHAAAFADVWCGVDLERIQDALHVNR